MIIQYYKGYIPLELLRDMTHTDNDGVSAFDLKLVSNKIGFKCDGIKVNNITNISTPCIAHVTLSNFLDHYIVIYKINKKKKELLIADPAKGLYKIKYDEFNKIFNNVILTFLLEKKLPVYTKPVPFKKYVFNILFSYPKKFIFVVILSLFITILSVITSFYIEIIYSVVEKNNYILLFTVFYTFFIAYIMKNLLDFIKNRIFLKVYRSIYASLTDGVFTKIIKLPYEYFKNRTTGEVVNRINDLQIISSVSIKIIVTFIMDLLFFIVLGVTLFLLNKILFLCSIVLCLLSFLILLFLNKILSKRITDLKEDKANVDSYTYESIKNFETIKGLSIENNVQESFCKLNNKYVNSIKKVDNLLNFEMFCKNIIFDLGICIVVFVGSYLSFSNSIYSVHLISFYFLVVYFLTPVIDFLEIYKDIKDAKISYERINELFIENEVTNINSHLSFDQIEFKNLDYKYYNQNKLLENINFKINKNDKVMVIGSSGSGKSTMLKLLKKYYPSNSKSIFINKIDITNLSISLINNNITYVSQNEYLFTDTLYNNLVLNRNISNDNLNEIMKLCKIDFLNLNGYIQEDGFNLSGGQKQRIILGRALLSNFNILILDEIFSEIDTNLERKILKKIFSKYPNKIIIVVSHRKDNIDLFNKVISLNKKECCCIERE